MQQIIVNTVVKALEALKGIDVIVMDVQQVASFTDTMVICTGTSNRHVKSLAENVVQEIKRQKVQPLSIEGSKEGEWVLIDLGDVIVHVMLQQTRDFYGLEKLWQFTPHKGGNA